MPIKKVNIIDKNLNLLPIFVAVWEERNLTRAAKRVGLSQPALSHSLAKLRDQFGDPLFVRVPHGLSPTPRAEQLYPLATNLLLQADALYRGEETDISRVQRTMTIAATNYFELRVIGSLMAVMESKAPGISLTTVSLQGELPQTPLDRGEIDLAVAAYFRDLPQGYRQKVLDHDPHVCLMRSGHPYLKTKRKLADYLRAKHLVIAVPLGVEQEIDRYLAAAGRKRNIVARLNNFLTPPVVISQTDYILTCPETLARSYAHWFDLQVVPTPVEVDPIQVKMIWHERLQTDPVHCWMRQQISDLVAE